MLLSLTCALTLALTALSVNANELTRGLPPLQSRNASSFFLSGIQGQPPQTRTFNFEVTEVMGAPDGVERAMLVINGIFPGPTIEANQGDTLIVNVHNGLTENRTSIHWHGLFQNSTPFFDGTAAVTECGILPGGTLQYKFTFGEFFGTTWYQYVPFRHSHSIDNQYSDGVVGPLIVHPTAGNPPLIPVYDAEMIVQLSDWYHQLAASYVATFLSPEGTDGIPGAEPVPDTGIINGLGQYHATGSFFTASRPLATAYRLRLIHTGSFPSIRFSLDSHVLTVIEADGTFVTPEQVAGLTLGVAQRYSVLVKTDQPPGLYWMRSELDEGMYDYFSPGQVTDIRGVVRYSNFKGPQTIPANKSDPGADGLPDLTDAELVPAIINNPPESTKQYNVFFFFGTGPSGGSLAFFNETSWSPLVGTTTLQQVHAAPLTYAPEGAHVISGNQLILTEDNLQVIDFQVNNLDEGPHPFHLHGNKFWVMGTGPGNYSGEALNSDNPLTRDTLIIQPGTWVVLRFVGNNPGVWTFHCHIAWHITAGLLLQFKIQPSKIAQLVLPESVTGECPS
ncbi:extracellular multicopper oxidase [Mycena sanguinolenta]|nr:extracellular multicopper oxidase [Mycena sanguinolenta]